MLPSTRDERAFVSDGPPRPALSDAIEASMVIDVRSDPTTFAEYAQIPSVFAVRCVIDVSQRPDGGFEVTERTLEQPYVKDYDALEHPTQWAEQCDTTRWGVLGAFGDGHRVGGAVLAFDTPGIDLLEGRRDLALLWDLRVSPDARRQGVGSTLFAAAEQWARAQGCTELKVETQNTNVPACRFYAAQGCDLRAVKCAAYATLPQEIQLLWYKNP